MFIWCAYCQRFLGEKAPYADGSITHGLCEACEVEFEGADDHGERTLRARGHMTALLDGARRRDWTVFERVREAYGDSELTQESLLIGLLQPALYEAGEAWQADTFSAADEHFLSSWCERAFATIARPPPSEGPVDLLGVQAPGNVHAIGPKFAGHVLALRGWTVDVVTAPLPRDQVRALIARLQPRVVGVSCAVLSDVPRARELVEALRHDLAERPPRFLLTGAAFRTGGVGAALAADDVEVARALDEWQRVLSEVSSGQRPSAGGTAA